MKKKILITGGTGLIGSRMIETFDPEEYSFNILTRSKKQNFGNVHYFQWDLDEMTLDRKALQDVDTIISLAGAGIADKRWTEHRKKVLIESRVKGNTLIAKSLKESGISVNTIICASAIGYYGDRGAEVLTADSAPAKEGFLTECSVLWEESALALKPFANRHSILRIGIVLSTKGGALEKMLLPLRIGTSGYFGNGNQYYSWIHIDDLVNVIRTIEKNKAYQGIFNGVNENPLPLKTFAKRIKNTYLPVAIAMPIPTFALKLAMGEMTNMLTNSTRVMPDKLTSLGFKFQYNDLQKAVNDLVKRKI